MGGSDIGKRASLNSCPWSTADLQSLTWDNKQNIAVRAQIYLSPSRFQTATARNYLNSFILWFENEIAGRISLALSPCFAFPSADAEKCFPFEMSRSDNTRGIDKVHFTKRDDGFVQVSMLNKFPLERETFRYQFANARSFRFYMSKGIRRLAFSPT